MPATDPRWTSLASSEVQQVYGLAYGVKRKQEDGLFDSPSTLHTTGDDPQEAEGMHKRFCPWPHVQEQQTLQQPSRNPSYDNNEQEMESQSAEQSPQVRPMNPTPTNSLIMNINEDDGAMDDYGVACDQMDSEGAVDMTQYDTTSTSNKHDQYCFGEEQSPNSGRMRCYCRPSWDTMWCSKSFNSDIY